MEFNIEAVEQTTSLTAKTKPSPKPINAFAAAVSTDKMETAFSRFLELEVAAGNASADTIRSYKTQIKLYFAWCRNNLVPPLEADRDDLRFYRHYLVEYGYANSTIAHKLSVVNSLYKAAVSHGLLSNNPAEKIKVPQSRVDPASNISFLELEELELLLNEVQSQLDLARVNKKRLPLMRDRSLLGIMSFEGTRTIELHQLKVEQIVRQGSNTGLRVKSKRSTRIVPLTKKLAAELEQYLALRYRVLRKKPKPQDYVFVSLSNNSNGKQLSRRAIRAIVDRYLEATGLKHKDGRTISAHGLRHTAATQSLRTGADLRQVQDLLGHADPRTTSIYTHVRDRWASNPANAVERKLSTKE